MQIGTFMLTWMSVIAFFSAPASASSSIEDVSSASSVTVQSAFVANRSLGGPHGLSFVALGVRYGKNLFSGMAVNQSWGQDTFDAEASMFFYKLLNYYDTETPKDSALVVPISMTFRYGMLLQKTFQPYFYGGVVQNTSSDPVLRNFGGVIGGGLFVHLGNVVSLRADAGTDLIGLGATARF